MGFGSADLRIRKRSATVERWATVENRNTCGGCRRSLANTEIGAPVAYAPGCGPEARVPWGAEIDAADSLAPFGGYMQKLGRLTTRSASHSLVVNPPC